MGVELALAIVALSAALAMKPWRMLPPQGPPWAWIITWAVLPLLWSADQLVRAPAAQPLSGASLLVLLSGWPLAVPALAAAAAAAALFGALPPDLALQRLVWLGFVPATLALGLGAAVRRWLPHHLFVYIFARGFFGTLLATAAAGWLVLWFKGTGAGTGFSAGDLLIGRWLAAWGEAIVTGMLVSIFVAYRPQWLATYSDALYLPKR
jgi:uncharacterized membrane protein